MGNLPEQPAPVDRPSFPSPHPPMTVASPPVQYDPHPAVSPSPHSPTGGASQMSSNVRYLFLLPTMLYFSLFASYISDI